ncbi:MAG TPA: helix-turn-helix domain-containing protein [Pyrinomonadaceae bacterium]|jgi:ArsR family transcriptional regulator|nr:helix-turn-helix domain-containing protein [Pyrinomonadaceae bacterium]
MDDKSFQKIAKALADPRRFEIFQTIAAAKQELSCGAVSEKNCTVSQPTVSHHIKELKEAGLLEVRSEGQSKYLTVNSELMNEYIAELQQRLQLSTMAVAS